MITFVLSGGSSYGALQVGALLALLEHAIKPELVVGSSIGAINGASLGHNISVETIRNVARLWRDLNPDIIYPGNYPRAILRLAQGKPSLFSNRKLAAYLRHHSPEGIETFAHLNAAKLYITATEMPSGNLHVFGDDPTQNIVDAIMASAALPPLHPPYQIGDKSYVDGSLTAKLPLKVAVEKGATTIYALHVAHTLLEKAHNRNAMAMARWSIAKLIDDQEKHELAWAREQKQITLHYIPLQISQYLAATDFSQSEMLIDAGYHLTNTYLDNLPPVSDGQLDQLKRRIWQISHQVKQVFFPKHAPNMFNTQQTHLPSASKSPDSINETSDNVSGNSELAPG